MKFVENSSTMHVCQTLDAVLQSNTCKYTYLKLQVLIKKKCLLT